MVDSISNNGLNPGVATNTLSSGIRESNAIQQANQEASQNTQSPEALDYVDHATISPEALQKLESDKKVLQFTRIAQRISPDQNPDKVAQLKDLVDSGRINEYLRSLNTDTLADQLLNSPSGTYLKTSNGLS